MNANLINCPICEKPIAKNCFNCPHCGGRRANYKLFWLGAIGILLYFLAKLYIAVKW